MSTTVDTKSLDAFAAKLKKAADTKGREISQEALNSLAAEVLQRSIRQTPRDTGNLARGWLASEGVKENGKTYSKEVYNPVDYAVYVEYGHRTRGHRGWVPGQFMMTNAVEDVEKMKDSIISGIVDKHFKDIFS